MTVTLTESEPAIGKETPTKQMKISANLDIKLYLAFILIMAYVLRRKVKTYPASYSFFQSKS